MKLEKKLYELGYVSGYLVRCYKKSYEWCVINIVLTENYKIDMKRSGVQRKGLNNFSNVEQVRELCHVYCIYENDLIRICKDL